ncbi:MAG: hypothetical protein JRE81_08355 [Deltaproteobacteria bacterium]|jgi:hypothetical protein|nr:hypothetical protein [Deltaproteobacteria bacterium]
MHDGSNIRRCLLALSLSALLFPLGASTGWAQSDVESLQKTIEEQNRRLEQQEQRLQDQDRRLEQLERALKEGAPAAPAGAAEPESGAKPSKETAPKNPGEAAQNRALRQDVDPFKQLDDDDFPKSVPLFGSPWRFSVGGYVKLDVITDFNGTGDPFQFVTATIPVPGDPDSPQPGGYTQVHAKESRINFELRNTGEKAPFTKIFFEIDFFDEQNPVGVRLRHAYFQYGNLIAGQTWTTLSFLTTLPFLIDFAYGDALYGGRDFQVRWQQPVNDRFSYAVALENFNFRAIGNPSDLPGTARTWLPLFAARVTFDNGRINVNFGGSLAMLRWDGDEGVANAQALQWALIFGARFFLDSKHKYYFALGASFGDGNADNILSLAEAGLPGAVLRPDGSLDTLYSWNLAPAFHLRFIERLSANFNYAWGQVQQSALRDPDSMQGDHSVHANLIVHITNALQTGAEYMIGWRKNVSGEFGRANRVQFMVMYSF